MKRIKNALTTNEAQITSVVIMSVFVLLALLSRDDWNRIPAIVYVIGGLLFPTIAFISNLISPINKR